ncbi:MAG: UDP-N-acetylglucosamine--N-acetylmuramyl-(pentapeptide) pyrophosphoryl-undecaprenol N-acetylglucosamine transferase, partial [Clostridia bacterium]|nr:UDP-N-acetylglucosamine--N-acetylmuramyl-(pentapeptide) pyrophosphoryl-undecaprenol N-acetylglucosamine transferase [Clostridia bacterium]
KRTIFDNGLPIVLSFWGSVGAKYMNEKMKDYLAIVAREKKFNHIHASGKGYYEDMKKALAENGALNSDNVILADYIYNMGEIMSQADLVLSRSGGTISELCAPGMPSVLVPSPYVAENHQERNARVLENAGAAVLLKENDATPESMYETIEKLVLNEQKLKSMSECALKLGHPDALPRIFDTVKSLLR